MFYLSNELFFLLLFASTDLSIKSSKLMARAVSSLNEMNVGKLKRSYNQTE